MGVFRFFFTSACHREGAASALAALRKKTGYTFSNIRKALEMHNNDAAKAEEWLKEQAKQMGWNAALKVQSRRASQGLIGVALNNKKVAMVEVNCETDFVAKNDKFKSMVELVAGTCLKQPVLTSSEDSMNITLNSEDLGKLTANNETLADHTALLIGSLGENIILKRAYCYETSRDDITLAASVHPPCKESSVLFGKYGSFISYIKDSPASEVDQLSGEIGDELCKHIIGMNPTKIGNYDTDEPTKNVDNEKSLIYQEFLADDSKTVGEFLRESGIKILEFKRFECGEENVEETTKQKCSQNSESILNES